VPDDERGALEGPIVGRGVMAIVSMERWWNGGLNLYLVYILFLKSIY